MILKLFKRRWFQIVGVSLVVATVVLSIAFYRYHRDHPLVFGESFFEHEHCMKQATMSLLIYASDHGGAFPHHTNGFGDALLLVGHAWLPSFTGPGYSTAVFEQARATGGDVPEDECGRIYVQGLAETNDHRIAILFDRDPSPGDHLNGFARINAKPVREVGFRDGSMQVVPVEEWNAFAAEQIELLVTAGFSRKLAESFYE